MSRRLARLLVCVLCSVALGCATHVPYVGQGPHPQIERGRPVPPIDILGNLLALPWKLLLLDWRFCRHTITERTEAVFVQYLRDSTRDLTHTKIRLNQYAPHKDLKRLITNRQVAWPYRIFPGLLTTLLTDVVLPGRLFPWGDYYNPWTDTIHLFSDRPAIGLHELGHAYDFSQQPYKGTYGLARLIPLVVLHQEWLATDEAISYLVETGDRRNELQAYKILYPAFGSYAGGYLIPLGGSPGILVGHLVGRMKAAERARFYRQLDAQTPPAQPSPAQPSP